MFIDSPLENKDEYKPKINIYEAFNFDSVNKQKKSINANDILYGIFNKLDNWEEPTKDEYDILTLYTGIYKIKRNDILKELVRFFIKWFGNDCDLNWMDTSEITDMSGLFMYIDFYGDISKWDVSNVTDMSSMFEHSKFNNDISSWNVSNVRNMNRMFIYSKFNNNIS
jgi:surface protein